MAYSNGQMEEYIQDGGKMVSNMEKAYIPIQKEFVARACGRTEIENIGSRKTDL